MTFMETHASVTRGAAMLHMTDTQTSSALVTDSVTAGGVTAKRAGQARNVSILSLVRCPWKPVRRSAEGPPTCPVMAEASAYADSAHAIHQETDVFMAKTASVMTGSVRT